MPQKKTYKREAITKALEGAGLAAGMSARTIGIRVTPETFDTEKKAVRFVATTEQPATVFDWDRFDFVDEVLLADGLVMPRNGQVPLLDTHSRGSVKDILGSAKDFNTMEIAGFRAVDCEVSFSGTPDGQEAAQKVEEGHATDVSVGYLVKESYWIPEGEKQKIEGRDYEGPLKVSTKWELKELSLAPIGADNLAKARAMAVLPQNEEDDMNKQLRSFLERQGLPKGATDQEAIDFMRKLEGKTRDEALELSDFFTEEDLQNQLNSVRAEAEKQARVEERARVTQVNDICRVAGMDDDFVRQHIDSGTSVEDVSKAIFEDLKKRNVVIGTGAHGGLEVGQEAGEKFRAAATDGLLLRSGQRIEKVAPGARDFRGSSMLDIAREALEMVGIKTRGMSKKDLAARALSPASSSDFPNIMLDVANKKLQAGYQLWPQTWRPIVAVTDATDFKELHAIKLSGAPDLLEIKENGEYQTADLSDAQEKYNLVTKGRIIKLTRVMIINDDLKAFTRIPQMFGGAARRMESAAVYGLINSNPTMSDGIALFHANHGNLAGTTGAPTSTTLSAGRTAMRTQTGLADEGIDVTPAFWVGPTTLETTAEILLRSTALPDDNKSAGVYNPWAGKLTPISDPILDAASTTAWYLFAHPDQVPVIEVAYLEGEEQPYVEDELDFDSDSLKIKVRHDFGAGVVDHVGAYKNAG